MQFDLGASATWADLVDAVASPGERACVDETLDDEELPAGLLDLALYGDDGSTQWPVWSNVYFGVLDDDTSHWPVPLWECLNPRTITAAYLSVSWPELEQLEIGAAADVGACVSGLLEDGSFVSDGAATLTTDASFEPGETLDQHFSALDERLGFDVGTCLQSTGAAAPADSGTGADVESPAPTEPPEPQELSPDDVYERIAPSIPLVETASAIGSGILIEGGYVVTNHHVVWPYESAWLVFPDGTEFSDVPVVGWDPFADLAVLGPVDAAARPLALSDGESMSPGSELFLIGYPAETDLYPEPSITGGVLSRFRHWDLYDLTLLQTDSAIAGGQSGGALVNSLGEVVGISTWSFSEAGFGMATSAIDNAEIVEALVLHAETGGRTDRRLASPGGDFEYEIELAGRSDSIVFTFEGTAGSVFAASMDGLGDGAFFVSGPTGVILHVDDNLSGLEEGSIELGEDGPYFLHVYSYSEEPSSYVIQSLMRITPFEDPDDGQQLAVGTVMAGVFDYPGDNDLYSLSLNEGDTIVLYTDAVVADTTIAILPRGASADEAAFDDDSGTGTFGESLNAELVYTAPVTGEYEIVVTEATAAGGAGYFLGIEAP